MLNAREVFLLDVKLIKLKKQNKRHAGGFILEANKHLMMIILFLVFFLGLILGHTFIKHNTELPEMLDELFSDFIAQNSALPFYKILTSQLLANILLLFLLFIFGMCAVGFPLPFIVSVLKGVSIGSLSSYIYGQYNLKGFGFCMLVFYPIQIMICLVLLRAGKENIEMSMYILKYISTGRLKTGESTDIKIYFTRYVIYLVVTVIITLASAVLSKYITPYFNF